MPKSMVVLLLGLILLLAALIGSLLMFSFVGDNTGDPEVRNLIEQNHAQMTDAFRRGDLLAVSGFYADDAIMLGPDGMKIQGRVAIDNYWTRIRGAKDWKLEVVEVGGSGEFVYELGRSALTTEHDGEENTYTCDFIVIWKQDEDKHYKIHVDSYN